MASLTKTSTGKIPGRAVQFMDQQGNRRTIRLGKVGLEPAREFKRRVEALLSSRITNQLPDAQLSAWLAGLPDKMHAKLAAVGLVQPRTPPPTAPTLGEWLDKYTGLRTDWKPSTRRVAKQTEGYLRRFFGDDREIDRITVGDAADWRAWMENRGLAKASIHTHARVTKSFFNAAVEHEIIPRNPFRKLSSAPVAADRSRYITPKEAKVILEFLPDVRWRALFGLARFAGLRVPSETRILTWADVDWSRGRLSVRSPKTERFDGHECRQVPITAKLMPLLQDAYDAAEEGQVQVITISGGHFHRMIRQASRLAGVDPWKDCFRALRRSCETELAMSFPQHAVSAWLGHSEAVSRKHYLQVPDELFARAAECAAVSSRIESQGVANSESDNRATVHETPCFLGSSGQKGGLPVACKTPSLDDAT